jgi:molybdopterin-binding protein
MNKLEATVSAIALHEGVAMITVENPQVGEIRIVTLQPPKDIGVGVSVTLLIHETKPVLLRTEVPGFANTLAVVVERIECGEILSRVHLRLRERAIYLLIDTVTLHEMSLIEGESLHIALKATDISIEVNR